MLTEIKSMVEFEEFEMKQDGIGLLGLIREVMCGVEKHLQNTWALVQASKSLYTFWQTVTMPSKSQTVTMSWPKQSKMLKKRT